MLISAKEYRHRGMACLRTWDSDENLCSPLRPHQQKRQQSIKNSCAVAKAAESPQNKCITQIYTDWANHYLEKVKSKRRIQDLPNDVTDGVILADVIEAVANQKLPDVNRKPKNASQMIDNIATCLRLLTALGIPLDDVTASDIHQGNLKSILTVFFALSRYKQQQKLQHQQQQQQQEMAKIPVAKTNVSSIPAVGPVKRPGQVQMISKIAVPSSVHYGSPQLRPISSTATSAASSRSASPSLCSTGSGNLSSTSSLIPRTPTKTNTSAKINSIKTPLVAHPIQKQSMLDKFKLFKPSDKSVGIPTALSKRPSSSSGFSSGRSEQGDSSFNSNNGHAAPLTTLAVFDQPPQQKKTIPNPLVVQNGTKERSIRTRAKNSPKLSPKVKRVAETEEIGNMKVNEQQATVSAKPFCSGGSGIPKPTAAVKGTAKVVKKPSVTEEAVLERTPGDGKEVPMATNKASCKSEIVEPSAVDTASSVLHDSNLLLNSSAASHKESALSSQVAVKCSSGTDSPTIRLPSIADTNEPSSQQPILPRSQNQPGHISDAPDQANHQLEIQPREKLADRAEFLPSESDQPDDCKAESSRSLNNNSSFVAKVFPMTGTDLEKNPSPSDTVNGDATSQCQDDDEDESMNVQPMTIFSPNKSLVKRHEYPNAPNQPFHDSPTTIKRAANTSYADPLDGYLSEGGASLYARKLHYMAVTQRNKDEDSYDDSSSLSSGISDPWTDVYGLHLKMEQNGVYPGIPNGYGTPLQNRRHPPAVAETSPYKQISSSQWKKFIEAGRLPSSERFQTELWKSDPRERSRSQQQEIPSPRKTEHKKLNTIESGKRSKVYTESESSERRQPAKGVPASFGYVKKNTGGYPGVDSKRYDSTAANGKTIGYKTANVATVPKLVEEHHRDNSVSANSNRSLERPKTRLKVSGGTQTDMSGRTLKPTQYKAPPTSVQTSLNQPCGSFSDSEYQTSNSGVKFALPVGASPNGKVANQQTGFKSYSLTAPIANQLSHNIRERLLLSGTQSLPKSHFNHMNARDSPGASQSGDKLRDKDKSIKYVVNGRNMHTDGSLSDTPYTAYWNKYHPKNSNDMTDNPDGNLDSVNAHGPKIPWLNNPPSPRLNRSNSVRSTKSEKVYPSMLQRNEEGELNNFSNQTLDNGADPSSTHRYAGSSTSRSSVGNYSALLSLSRMNSKEEDCHGSSLSLVSTASSLYSSQEEKQASEIRKLRRELAEAHEKVNTLSGQLSTNAHVVAAFEQSLASMTSRLQSLTMTAEHKENELQDLRQFIDQLRKQGVQTGSLEKIDSQANQSSMSRQLSSDSVSSVTSQTTNMSSVSSLSPSQPNGSCSPSPSPSLKKKSWLRNSFSKAFSRSKRPQGGGLRQGTGSDSEDSSGPVRGIASTWSAPSSPMLASHHPHPQHSIDVPDGEADRSIPVPETVQDLKKQLREKDMVLTDIRLEALSSAHQLEALKETVSRMRNEMLTLKQDNERLHRQVEHQSAASSPHHTVDRRQSHRRSPADEAPVVPDWMLGLDNDKDSKSIAVRLHIKQKEDECKSATETTNLWLIGYIAVSGKTRWDHLDNSICKLFNEYLRQVDPQSHLGLDEECLTSYRVGEVVRSLNVDEEVATPPELLPCGYLVGDCNFIAAIVKQSSNYDLPACLALDTLIPLPILSRYVSLLNEHGRVILSGPSGTGKSYLARKLADYCIEKDETTTSTASTTTLKVDASSCKEVRQYLSHVCESLLTGNTSDIPSVIILEDLHLAPSLCEIFSPLSHFDSVRENQKFPYLIGTTGPMAQSSVHLQLQFNFRWILLANHAEPVHGLVQRFLRRRLIQSQLLAKSRDGALERVVEWIPRCWTHLNKFLETHNSADVTIGPRWFLQVPADATCSQIWFTDLWNYTLAPYLLHAAKEGLQLYGKRAAWEDPTLWILSTYPWAQGSACDALMRLRPEDVGYDSATRPNSTSVFNQDRDPLVNMLMKLQEAAGLPSPVDNSENSSESIASTTESKATDSV
ncbi:neuron navigator 2 isoform X2 [Daphnia magna]|uniref:neuron navigator 2 isoform X2 n=1 Tax=Daphnia magna TaxID=35525 RepID=UPI001E1BC891|nr:neuron navigator 2 isoform X2 [Daphnia magna]